MKNNSEIISDFSANHPAGWNVEQFRANWFAFLESIVRENSTLIPPRRVQYQVEQAAAFREIVAGWDSMDGFRRLDAWKRLLMIADESSREVLPVCVQCGECCRRGSPTLHREDLELLRSGKIPWGKIMTLRSGEPARSPFDGRPFLLPEERIKIREKEGSRECTFFDSEAGQCAIYDDRPLQCRAQACWDPMPARDLAEQQPFLKRADIFEGVGVLLDMIAEHENRCGFASLADAFEALSRNGGENVDEILRHLSYEDHFRRFVSEKFQVPGTDLELLFGRSFTDMVPLFGYRVTEEPDGTRCLVPDETGD
ncbi:MAG: YkgJ family cysteine cluster protein [Desulfobacteraceae bacterium]|nr:YkgJ family cysteine cluster protein [Desulfobacteraceae bacterium]